MPVFSDQTAAAVPLDSIPIVLNAGLVERVQFSRSPSRARRRAALGHKQHHIVRPIERIFAFSDKLLMHPETYERIKAALTKEMRR